MFLAQLGHSTLPSVWSYYAEEAFDWTPDLIGASLMFVGLTAAIVQGGLTRVIVPRVGERAAATFATSVTCLGLFAYAWATEGWMVYAIIAFSALGGLAQPAFQGIMSRTMPADAQGELQGAVGAIASVAMILGPPMMTQIFAAFSTPNEPFLIGGVTLLADGVPFYFPGAPFAFGGSLMLLALMMLFVAFTRIPHSHNSAV